MSTATLTFEDLQQFTGTETWYRHGLFRDIRYTDGAKYVADHGGAYWLLDTIAIAQHTKRRVQAEPFQVWTLTKTTGTQACLTCEDGNHQEVYREAIPFTDFPLETITLWYENNVIYLPGER